MDQLAIPVVLVVALGLAAGFALLQRRNERRLAVLMARIDELEGQIAADGDTAEPVEVPAPLDENRGREEVLANVSADVLAGRTSYVRRVVEGQTPRPASAAELAIRCVHARLEENLLPAELASELSVSLRTLERALTAELGCTPRQLILAMKMREARRLLETGRYRVNEVAHRLGFSSPSNFSRRFRSFYHMSPTAFLRRNAA
jgi:AraC-like DNA-binding protein